MELHNNYKNLLTKVNDLTISYNDVGEGSIPVIFLHGFPFDKSMWKGQLDTLKSLKSVSK
jgi:pimeloyl-ACP methyl ester carboxylesterase